MKYRKKPVVIDAVQWTGQNSEELSEFMNRDFEQKSYYAVIKTLEGNMLASKGDFIIKGVQGEFYPCKPDIFEQTYELVGDTDD